MKQSIATYIPGQIVDTAFVSLKKKKKKKTWKMQKLHSMCEFENAHEYGILNKNLWMVKYYLQSTNP